jgi:antitoxin component of MazEF toxin-antitoxin module
MISSTKKKAYFLIDNNRQRREQIAGQSQSNIQIKNDDNLFFRTVRIESLDTYLNNIEETTPKVAIRQALRGRLWSNLEL